MNDKPLALKDKKVKKQFKAGERKASEKDFFELLKRAVKPQK